MFKRKAEDYYDGHGILRLDVGSGCEKAELLYDILSLVIAPFHD